MTQRAISQETRWKWGAIPPAPGKPRSSSQTPTRGDFAGLPIGEQDPIIGPASAEAQMTLPGEPMPFLFDFKRFITTRCGEYFFMPSLTALRGIAAKKY